jgi:hypothetical protein
MPTVIFVDSSFMNANMSGVISPRGMVSVPSTSKRARMRGFSGVVNVVVVIVVVIDTVVSATVVDDANAILFISWL